MSKVIFTKGLPASGKSTWARNWVDEKPNRVRINRDDLRNMMGLNYRKDKESLVLAASLNILENALRLDRDVVCDNTNLNKSTLKHYIKICEKHGAIVEYKIFSTPPEICVERDAKRERPVGESAIMNMFRKYKDQLF